MRVEGIQDDQSGEAASMDETLIFFYLPNLPVCVRTGLS